MMSMTLRAMTGFLLLGLLAACGSSPPARYYVLSARDGPVPVGNSPSLGVGPVAIPGYLNRDKLVTNREGNTLVVAASDWWAEPLADGVQRVLAVNLAGLLNTQSIHLHPWHPQQSPDYGVRVNLLSLDAGDGAATLAAEWVVYHPAGGEVISHKLSRLEQTLANGMAEPEQIAAAYSDLLFKLSEAIATAIETDSDSGGD